MTTSDKIQNPTTAQLASALRRGVLRLARRLRATSPAEGLTSARLSALRWLHEEGAMTPGQIAAADHLQPQSVTRLLAALEKDGLIVRDVDESDRRRAVVRITPAGTKMLRAEAAHRDKWLTDAMTAQLSPAERAILKQASVLLERLADELNPQE
jgi:DNA-binding MarR family transcriptional regulator